MSKLIGASIDLSKIDKSRIKEKDGHKYYDITIALNDEPDRFGNDVAITEGQTKEERLAKSRKVYLGNGKIVWDSNRNI